MSLSFKEYCSTDLQSQLISIIRCREGGVVFGSIDALKTINNCASVALIAVNQIVVASDYDCDADLFLAELEGVVSSLPFEAAIEETRFGCLDSLPVQTALSDRFSVASPDSLEGVASEDTIYLECGSIFGSGHHPSTRLTVKALEDIALGNSFPAEVLDVGCGSGILSFICNRLGAKRVLGIDICQNSIEVAQKNREINCSEDQVRFCCGSLSQVADVFDLIVANISPSVLHELLKDFSRLLSANGKVVLSGLHTGQVDGIVRQMSDICELQKSYADGSWRALSFQYPS